MHADWKAIARSCDYVVSRDDTVTVSLDGGTTQVLYCGLAEGGEVLRVWSIIARPRTMKAIAESEPLRYAWERNRLSDLVGFSIDGRGRLIGETWIPLHGLTKDELGVYFIELARVCDWHEFRLAGVDEY